MALLDFPFISRALGIAAPNPGTVPDRFANLPMAQPDGQTMMGLAMSQPQGAGVAMPDGAPGPMTMAGMPMPSFGSPDTPAPGSIATAAPTMPPPRDIRPAGLASAMAIQPASAAITPPGNMPMMPAEPGATPAKSAASGGGFFDALGKIYGAGGPGDTLMNLGFGLMSTPGNPGAGLMKGMALTSAQKLAGKKAKSAEEAKKLMLGKDTWRALVDPAERAKYGIAADDKNVYQINAFGQLKSPGKPTTNVNLPPTEKAFDTKAGNIIADRYGKIAAAGDTAESRMSDLTAIRELSGRVGNQGAVADWKIRFGPLAKALGVDVGGLGDLQAWNAIVQKMAPQMRAVGSGSTSDIEFKGMLASIPQASQDPAARKMILDTMEGAAKDAMARRDIALRVLNKEIDRKQADAEMKALPDYMANWRSYKASMGAAADPVAKKTASDFYNKAIAAGKDRDATLKYLRDRGYPVEGL